jgi:hypothetical protein
MPVMKGKTVQKIKRAPKHVKNNYFSKNIFKIFK